MQPVNPATVQVLLPLAIDQSYSYALADGQARPSVGSIVQVSLGNRSYKGVVWGDEPPVLKKGVRLKAIEGVVPAPLLSSVLMSFVDWVAGYTLTPRGMILRMVLREPEGLVPAPPKTVVVATGLDAAAALRLTPARAKVLEIVQQGQVLEKSSLATSAGVSASVVDGLIKSGLLRLEKQAQKTAAFGTFEPRTMEDMVRTDLVQALSSDQQAAVAAHHAENKGFRAVLLDGVTGAGKTAVYLEMLADALVQGKQGLVLIPEIALTTSFLARLEARFGFAPVTWHSGLSPRQRLDAYRSVYHDRAPIVVGARSALFLPYQDLGLIVVDEEHESAYKQEDRGIYHARDMAVKRGQLSDCPVILASATPSLETWANVQAGRYGHICLPNRFSGQEEPAIRAIDMRGEAMDAQHWLSDSLKTAISQRLERGEQALLFLNRRGYAPLTLCRGCGHRMKCPNCTAWLTEHRFRKQLLCHHCGYQSVMPKQCPSCKQENSLVPCGPGVERIAEEAREAFPDARMMVLSSDLMANPADMRRELAAVEDGRVDLIVGTQILAKGHNFPKLTLVGVVDADLGLEQVDPRAGERTFQLLHQVIGRAGRAQIAGEGVLQSYNPEHPVLQALIKGDREAFYAEELRLREQAAMPPFGRLVGLIVSGSDRAKALGYARALTGSAPQITAGVQLLGPAEATIAQLRGRYRFRLLLKAPRSFDVQGYCRAWLQNAPKMQGDLRVQIDIDPQSFY